MFGTKARIQISLPVLLMTLLVSVMAGDAGADTFVPPPGAHIVSVSTNGTPGNAATAGISIDDDGRFVVLESFASNLVSGDTNDFTDVFLRDRDTDGDGLYDEAGFVSTVRVSVANDEAQANFFNRAGNVSDDGRYVSFWSAADNLVAGDTNNLPDVFVRDLLTGTTERVTVTSSEAQLEGFPERHFMSADGNRVTFDHNDGVLTGGEGPTPYQAFIRDRAAGTTIQYSVGSDGTPADEPSAPGPMSADGRYALFATQDENMVGDDASGTSDLFVRDLTDGTTRRMNVDAQGDRLGGTYFGVFPVHISRSGRYVSFGLFGGIDSSIWLHDRDVDVDGIFDEPGEIATRQVDRGADGTRIFHTFELASLSDTGSVSDDGRFVYFESLQGRSRVASIHDRDADVDGLFDEAGAMELITVVKSPPFPTNLFVGFGEISGDGHHALWSTFDFSSNDGQAYVSDVEPVPFTAVTPGFVRGNQWFLTNNLDETSNYRPIPYGNSDETKVVGDWNADGATDIGVVRGNQWLLSTDRDPKAEIGCRFGLPSDRKIAGDWDGDGDSTPGIVRGNVWHLSDECDGDAEHVLAYGSSSDTKLAGDWDGDSVFTPGVVRGNTWYLLDDLTTGPADHVFGYGSATDKKVAGDWDGDGTWTPGVVRGVFWFLSEENAAGPADHVFNFGFGGTDVVVAGDWDAYPG